MEKKKLDLGAVAIGAGKNAKAFLGKAKDAVVKAADQNDDGSLDLKDAAVLAEAIGNSAKNAVAAAKEGANAIAQERERQRLRPIFPADIMSPEFRFSKLIRLTEPDKRRRANELCQGSIGFMDEQKGLRIVNLYRDRLEAFGLTFLPNMNCDFYYVDPSDETAYIALDEYFAYLKKVRVDELQMVAQSLGAKHFRVTYQEEKATFSGYKVKAKGDAKGALGKVNAGATHDLEAKDVVSVAVAAEMECPGHAPVRPKLRYLREEPCIQNLVSLRLGENSPTHLHYRLKLSNSSGLKISDAVQIDAALKAMKMTGNSTVTSEAQNESRRLFEYEIDFWIEAASSITGLESVTWPLIRWSKTNNSVTSTEHNTPLNPIDFAEYQTMLHEIEEEGLSQVEGARIYEAAEENAKMLIRNFLSSFVDFEVVFLWTSDFIWP